MANKEMKELLDDIMIEKLATAPINELLAEYNISSDVLQTEDRRFLDRIKDCKQQHNKNRLVLARKRLDEEKEKHEAVDVVGYLERIGKDAKTVLIDLLIQKKLPENLTVAHREGKDISDEDAKQILANLIAMGAIKIDDKGD